MKSKLAAAAFALVATVQPGHADQARYEAAMIIQTGLSRTGDFSHAIDGQCGPLMADAANRYMMRRGEIGEEEKADVFCHLLPSYYFLIFKGKEKFAVEGELGFETMNRDEVEALFKSCGGPPSDSDPDFFADGSKAAMFAAFEIFLETPTDDSDQIYRCMLKQRP